jgi:transposase
MSRAAYPTDLTDAEYTRLAPHLPAPAPTGRPRLHPLRELLDAMRYLVRTGCQWRLLPQGFPPWRTVYHYWRAWRRDGTWERLHTALRERLRVRGGRPAQPSAGILDSQSVRTTSVGGPRGWDGAKKLAGRKRHVLVDTGGLVLRVLVHPADVQDRAAVPRLLAGATRQFPRLRHVWVDQGYTSRDPRRGAAWITRTLGWTVTVTGRRQRPVPVSIWTNWPAPPPPDWRERRPHGVLPPAPRRWVVERTFAWLGQSRRLSKDYERLPATSEALVYAAMIALMARRLARSAPATTTS